MGCCFLRKMRRHSARKNAWFFAALSKYFLSMYVCTCISVGNLLFFLTQSFFYSCCGAYCIPGLKTDRARKSYFVHATRQFVSWHLTIMESALLNCPRKTLKTSYLAKIHDMSTTNELTLYCAALQIHSI